MILACDVLFVNIRGLLRRSFTCNIYLQRQVARPTLRGTDHPILADRDDLFDINLALLPIKTFFLSIPSLMAKYGAKEGPAQDRRSAAAIVQARRNVMAHALKPDLVFRRNGRVHLNRRGHQCSRLLAAEVCASAVVMLDTTCLEVV